MPKTGKTLKNTTQAKYSLREMDSTSVNNKPGEFVYFGIEKGLRLCVNKQYHLDDKLMLQFNLDGVPIYANGQKELWPI